MVNVIFRNGKACINGINYNTDTSRLLKEFVSDDKTSGYSLFVGVRGKCKGKYFIAYWCERNDIRCKIIKIIPISRAEISTYTWNNDYSPALV